MKVQAKGYASAAAGLIHWRQAEGPGAPIVLLHRTPVSSACFEALLRRLGGRRRAIALDTPGFGQSFRPTGAPTTVSYAAWFLEALNDLRVEHFHLYAHHTGTHFAAEMARMAPQRVRSLTLSGVLYAGFQTRASFRGHIGDAPPVDEAGDYVLSTWKTMKDLFPKFDPALVHEEFLGALSSPQGRNQAFGAVFGQDFASVLKSVLTAGSVPVRVFQAEDDPLGFCLDALRRAHPDLPVVLHGPAGMAAPERQPDAISDALIRYAKLADPYPARSKDPQMPDRKFELVRHDKGFDLRRTEGETPTPGPGEVLVKVRAVSLNRRDLSIRDLSYPAFGDWFTPLSDAAGEVVAVGEGVEHVAVGDKVTSTFFQDWPSGRMTLPAVMSALGAGGRGVLADHVVLSAGGVAPIPQGLSFEEASTLPCAAVTAWSALFTHGGLRAGDWLLVQGTGGVALFALQFAVAAGAKVVITSSSDEKLERAKAMGASVGINYAKTPEWEVAVKAETGGVNQVLELGGVGTLAKSSASLAMGGHIALIGALAGFGGDLSASDMVIGAQSATASSVGSRAEHLEMTAFLARHCVKPVIDQVFDFEDMDAAYARTNAGAFGKVVVRLS